MTALLRSRLRLSVVSALAIVFLIASGLTALRLGAPHLLPGVELLICGWLGVALGRLTMGSEAGAKAIRDAAPAKSERPSKKDRVEHTLHHVAKALETHAADCEAFSKRLDDAITGLSRQHPVGSIHGIALTLIADNRDMQDRLGAAKNRLEESRQRLSQLQANLERAEEAGLRDVVTLIGNRRYFEAAFVEEVDKARRCGDDLCVALADLDRFKLINDRFGHLVGDRVLRSFADILLENVRGQDKAARFGGDEFGVIFPGTRLVDAVSAADRIRKALESMPESIGEWLSPLTASFGVAVLEAEDTPEDLLRRADDRLYQAKARGRNRVVAAGIDERAPSASLPARGGRVAIN